MHYLDHTFVYTYTLVNAYQPNNYFQIFNFTAVPQFPRDTVGLPSPHGIERFFLLINCWRYGEVSIIVYCQTGDSCRNSLKVVSVKLQITNPDNNR